MATSMDPLIRSQDVKRCQFCPGKDRKSAAETVCSSCQVNLCKECVGLHVISDPKVKHDVVTFEFKYSEIIPPECSIHEDAECDIFCQQCNSPVCLKCLTSGAHENHDVQQISEVYKSRRNKIIKDNKELVNFIAPFYDSIISDIDTTLTNVVHQHNERHQTIKTFGEKCHKLVDSVIEKYLNESKSTQRKDVDSLVALKVEFEMTQSLIQLTVNENKSILDSSESSELIHYTSRNEDFRIVPCSFELTVPPLDPLEFTEEELCLMIGVIPKTIKTNVPAFITLPTQTYIEPYKQFIDKPIVMESVETGYEEINGINCIPYTEEFYVSGNSEIIQKMNTEGEILDEITTSSRGMPYDTGVTPEGCLVYTESLSIGINIEKSGRTRRLIPPEDWTPMVICCTSTDEFLIAVKSIENDITQSKILRCCDSDITQEIQYDDAGNPLYSFPFSIEENKNLDIIVSDYNAKKVVVVDKMGTFRFHYKGNLHPKNYKKFTPCGLTTDGMCHIFIADPSNHIIHVIDVNGKFLFYIANCELDAPFDLSADEDDYLFVAERLGGKVKKIKLFE